MLTCWRSNQIRPTGQTVGTDTVSLLGLTEKETDTSALSQNEDASTNTPSLPQKENKLTNTEDLHRIETSTNTPDVPESISVSIDTNDLNQIKRKLQMDKKEEFKIYKRLKDLEQEENKITEQMKQLKIINQRSEVRASVTEDERKTESDQHVKWLRQLGNIHKKKAKLTNRKLDYVKAIALYETAGVHHQECSSDEENDVKKREIKRMNKNKEETLVEFLRQCTKETELDDKIEQIKKDNELNKNELRDIRENVKSKMAELEMMWKTSEEEYIQNISDILKWIHDQTKKFIGSVINQSKAILGFENEKITFIAFGSLSRKEMTPYSDIEFAVVVESDDLYMESELKERILDLVMCIHIKILMLGETTLPSMHIESLKGWYYDDREHVSIKRGMSFDGLMPQANKTPYFEDQRDGFSLLDTKKAFTGFFEKTDDLSDKLFFYKGDFETLYGADSVMAEMKNKFKEDSEKRNKVLVGIKRELKDDLVKYSCTKKIYDAKFNNKLLTQKELNVKKELYRLPSVVISNLLHLFKSETTCIWEVDKLEGMNRENLINLKMLISLATDYRLRCYAGNNGQVDEAQGKLFPDILYKGEEDEAKHFTDELTLRYYLTAIPLALSIEEENETEGNKEDMLFKLIGTQKLYDPSFLNHAVTYLLMRQQEKAKTYLGKANKEYSKNGGSLDNNKRILQMLCNMNMKDAEGSKEFMNPDIVHSCNIDVINTLGNALIQAGDLDKAEVVLRECVRLRENEVTYKLLMTALASNGKGEELHDILSKRPDLPEFLTEDLMDDIDDVISEWQDQTEIPTEDCQILRRAQFPKYRVMYSLAAVCSSGIVIIVEERAISLSDTGNVSPNKAILCSNDLKEIKTLNTTGEPQSVIAAPECLNVAVLCRRDGDPGHGVVQVFNESGDHQLDIPLPSEIKPVAIAVNSAGQIVIADNSTESLKWMNWHSGEIEHSTPDGKYIKTRDVFIAVDKHDNIIISNMDTIRCVDMEGNEVFVYNGEGDNVLKIPSRTDLWIPMGVCVDQHGNILVADYQKSRVQLVSADGNFIQHVISEKNGLNMPRCLSLDTEGNLLVGTGNRFTSTSRYIEAIVVKY